MKNLFKEWSKSNQSPFAVSENTVLGIYSIHGKTEEGSIFYTAVELFTKNGEPGFFFGCTLNIQL